MALAFIFNTLTCNIALPSDTDNVYIALEVLALLLG